MKGNVSKETFAIAAEIVFPGKMGQRAELAPPSLSLVGWLPAAGIPFLNGLTQGLESALNSQTLRVC